MHAWGHAPGAAAVSAAADASGTGPLASEPLAPARGEEQPGHQRHRIHDPLRGAACVMGTVAAACLRDRPIGRPRV